MKFAAIDAGGRRGTIEHGFDVTATRAGSFRMSDVFVGEISPTVGFLPSPWLLPGTSALPTRIEVFADAPTAFTGANVTLELARPNAPVFASLPLSLKDSTDPRRRIATATLSIGSLPAGEYLVTAVLQTADGGSIRRSRVFTKR